MSRARVRVRVRVRADQLTPADGEALLVHAHVLGARGDHVLLGAGEGERQPTRGVDLARGRAGARVRVGDRQRLR